MEFGEKKNRKRKKSHDHKDVLLYEKEDRRLLSYVSDKTKERKKSDRRGYEGVDDISDFEKFMHERKSGIRYKVDYGCVMIVKDDLGKRHRLECSVSDISNTGMLLKIPDEAKDYLEDAKKIKVSFRVVPGSMPEGYEMHVREKVKLVRIFEKENGECMAGIAFTKELSRYAAANKDVYLLTISSLLLVFVTLVIMLMRAESIIYFRFNKWLYLYSIITAVFLLSRYLFGALYRHKKVDPDFTPGVSILIPCFNEAEWIQRTIVSCMNQEYPIDKLEVLVIDDCSSDGSVEKIREIIEKLKEQSPERYDVEGRLKYFVQETNAGKREALVRGAMEATHDLVVFVDSDSFLDPFAIRNLVQPFKDPKMGGVAGRTDVANTYTNMLTKMQAVRYYIAFRVMKAAEGLFDCVTCLSGPLSCYRKEIILEYKDEWLNQRFLGQKATFGDDRSMTNFVLRHHRTTYQDTAVCSTIVPNRHSVFLKQQMRWKRSWLRESLIAGTFIWKKEPFAAITFYMGLVVPIAAPIVVIYNLLYVPLTQHIFPTTFLLGLLMMSMLMSMAQLLLRKSSTWIYGLLFCLYYELVLLWQMPIAWFTFWKSTWGTRMTPSDVKAKKKKIQKKLDKKYPDREYLSMDELEDLTGLSRAYLEKEAAGRLSSCVFENSEEKVFGIAVIDRLFEEGTGNDDAIPADMRWDQDEAEIKAAHKKQGEADTAALSETPDEAEAEKPEEKKRRSSWLYRFETGKDVTKTFRSVLELAALGCLLALILRALFTFTEYVPYDDTDKAVVSGEDHGFIALSYIGVNRESKSTLISAEKLREHLGALHELGYVTVTQKDIEQYYNEGKPLPDKALFLMFEDGRNDTAIFAQSVMEQYNYLGTMFTYGEKFRSKDSHFLMPSDLEYLEDTGFWEIGTNGYRLSYINVFDRFDRFIGELSSREYSDMSKYLGRDYEQYIMDFIRDENDFPVESLQTMKERITGEYDLMESEYTQAMGKLPDAYTLMHANSGMFGSNEKVSAVNEENILSRFKMNFNREGYSLNTAQNSIYDLTRMQPQSTWSVNHLLMRIRDDLPEEDKDFITFERGDEAQAASWETECGAVEFKEDRIILTSESEGKGILRLTEAGSDQNIKVSVNLKGNKWGYQALGLRQSADGKSGIGVILWNNVLQLTQDGEVLEELDLYEFDGNPIISVEEQKRDSLAAEYEALALNATSVEASNEYRRLKRETEEMIVPTVEEGAEEYRPTIQINELGDRELEILLQGDTISVRLDGKDVWMNHTLAHSEPGSLVLECRDSEYGYSQRNIMDDVYDGVFEKLTIENADSGVCVFTDRPTKTRAVMVGMKDFWNSVIDWFIENL